MTDFYSRNFPTSQAEKVGNIPFAFSAGKSDKSAMAINELRQRVDRRLRELKIGPVEAAQSVPGLERNYIRDLIEGKKESFSQSKSPLVAQALRWNLAELLGSVEILHFSGHGAADDGIAKIPLLDKVTAGKLKSSSSQIPVEDVPLLAFADLGRGDFFALTVEGDSMDRLSPDGSVIIINQADRTLVTGRAYVISRRGEATFKLWRSDPPRFSPYSTNPVHEPVFVKSKEAAQGMVVGRVKRTVLDL
jgi:SOS-response transcriptional repressor LexA